MSVLPSLIAALERAAGDCLVLRSGERPHVVAGEARHDVGHTVLSAKAVEALAAQILSPEGQKELAERSSVQEVLGVDLAEGSLTARAERAGDEIYVELRRHRRAPKPVHVEAPAPVLAAVAAPPQTDHAPMTASVAHTDAPHGEMPQAEAPVETPAAVTPSAPEPIVPAAPQPAPVTQFVVERFEPVAEDVPIAHGPAPEPMQMPVAQAEAPAAHEPIEAPAVHEPVEAPVAHESAEVPIARAVETPIARMEEPAPAVRMEEPAPREEAVAVQAPFVNAPAPVAVAAPVAVPVRRAAVVPAPAASRDLTDDLDELIADAAERGATALYLRAGQVPSARIDERLQPLDDVVVSAERMQEIVASCTSGGDGWMAGEHGEWVREFDLAGLVKCFPFADHAGSGVVIRLAPRSSAMGLQRHVPRQIRRACESEDGLLLVAAPTQADLLPMLGAVADLAARKRAGYVICLEPADGLKHPIAGAFVSERKLEGSADEMRATIRRAVQEAPDILVVAAPEPPVAVDEVILSARAAGRLVVLGIVAPTALRGVESVLTSIGADREPQVRKVLAGAMRAAFGYRGLRRLGGGRLVVQDIVVGTADVRARLERADFGAIEQVQRQGSEGMRTLDAALARAVARRQVSLRQAAALATSKADLVMLTRRDARERRALVRESRGGERRQGVLRAI